MAHNAKDIQNVFGANGAIRSPVGLSLPEIWCAFHGKEFDTLGFGDGTSFDDEEKQRICYELHHFSAGTWSRFLNVVGWTVYGAVALSWCKGAKLAQTWEGWLASGFPLKPLPEFERPARFLNPALLPQTNKASEINQWVLDQDPPDAETYQLAVCACIAALKEPLVFNLKPDTYKDAMPQIAAFLKSRMLQKPDRSADEEAVIEAWTAKIKGTEWDIWSEEAA